MKIVLIRNTRTKWLPREGRWLCVKASPRVVEVEERRALALMRRGDAALPGSPEALAVFPESEAAPEPEAKPKSKKRKSASRALKLRVADTPVPTED